MIHALDYSLTVLGYEAGIPPADDMKVENWQTVLKHLIWLRDNGRSAKFDMDQWIAWQGEVWRVTTLEHARANALRRRKPSLSPHECGTTACLAGFAALLGDAPDEIHVGEFGQSYYGLKDINVARYVFHGHWRRDEGAPTIDDAIAYMQKAIAYHNPLVKLGRTPEDD